MNEEKPLFIPLKAKYFQQFKDGTKKFESRPFGARWNEKTCTLGRKVVLSKGYGKYERLTGAITGVEVIPLFCHCYDFSAIYGDTKQEIRIHIEVKHE